MSTEALLSSAEHFATLVELLQENKLWVRWSTIQVLATLSSNRRERTEEAVLACPAGMERLADVLDDRREEIRNDMLLLLLRLTENSEQIQNFVAFRDGFHRLFQIMALQGMADGGIIVQAPPALRQPASPPPPEAPSCCPRRARCTRCSPPLRAAQGAYACGVGRAGRTASPW